jgi:predicted nucleic acid-binding protein
MSADVPVDPDDALVLGEARAGAADVFVTGDAAVLAIPAIGGMKILSPRRFWDQLHSGAA